MSPESTSSSLAAAAEAVEQETSLGGGTDDLRLTTIAEQVDSETILGLLPAPAAELVGKDGEDLLYHKTKSRTFSRKVGNNVYAISYWQNRDIDEPWELSTFLVDAISTLHRAGSDVWIDRLAYSGNLLGSDWADVGLVPYQRYDVLAVGGASIPPDWWKEDTNTAQSEPSPLHSSSTPVQERNTSLSYGSLGGLVTSLLACTMDFDVPGQPDELSLRFRRSCRLVLNDRALVEGLLRVWPFTERTIGVKRARLVVTERLFPLFEALRFVLPTAVRVVADYVDFQEFNRLAALISAVMYSFHYSRVLSAEGSTLTPVSGVGCTPRPYGENAHQHDIEQLYPRGFQLAFGYSECSYEQDKLSLVMNLRFGRIPRPYKLQLIRRSSCWCPALDGANLDNIYDNGNDPRSKGWEFSEEDDRHGECLKLCPSIHGLTNSAVDSWCKDRRAFLLPSWFRSSSRSNWVSLWFVRSAWDFVRQGCACAKSVEYCEGMNVGAQAEIDFFRSREAKEFVVMVRPGHGFLDVCCAEDIRGSVAHVTRRLSLFGDWTAWDADRRARKFASTLSAPTCERLGRACWAHSRSSSSVAEEMGYSSVCRLHPRLMARLTSYQGRALDLAAYMMLEGLTDDVIRALIPPQEGPMPALNALLGIDTLAQEPDS